jgi:UDP-2,4-diacetamido-2,4,6-trideoxy-beta-L-altropyranose hydrolase
METLLFRVDAGPQIGTGHLMRCLALAQAWKDQGGKAVFITSCRVEGLLARLRDEGFKIHTLPVPAPDDWSDTRGILGDNPGDWVVLDGYHFDGAYQQKIKGLGCRLLVIDDMAHLEKYYADIVLNQNLHAELLQYSCEPYTRLLLGTKYVLLRREFRAWQGKKRTALEKARRVLVTLGGADPANYTLKVVRALQQVNIPDLEATVIIGGSNANADILQAETARGNVKFRLVRDVKNMPELMARADVAVVSAGTTVWELAFMGVPGIVGITAEIEEYLVEGLRKYGLFTDIGWFKDVSVGQLKNTLLELIRDGERRRNMTELGRRLVDGAGCDNTIKELLGRKV